MSKSITINGSPRDVEAGDLETLLEELSLSPDGVAVEKNRDIVFREDYERTPVEEGDVLEIVTMAGGG
jgi:thiamine biosynthesis protein ThiS